tara:strand:+ start:1875 stop:2105 length:231 start_codon:yes stop_codon:yes gene_type:complete
MVARNRFKRLTGLTVSMVSPQKFTFAMASAKPMQNDRRDPPRKQVRAAMFIQRGVSAWNKQGKDRSGPVGQDLHKS